MIDVLPSLEGHVHVWTSTVEELRALGAEDRFEGWLGEEERQRYHRYRRPQDRELYLFGRAVLRHTLSRYADVEPGAWTFVAGTHGRPELGAPFADLRLRFNLSHTPGVVACIVGDRLDVGVDVEDTRRGSDPIKLARTVCSPREREELQTLPPEAARRRFYEIWTLKESYLKARGEGLTTLPLQGITFAEGDPAPSVAFEPSVGDDPLAWRFELWRPTRWHQGALALRCGSGPVPATIFGTALSRL